MAGAVFLISRVGNSDQAEKFLGELDREKELEQMVYCSKEKLDPEMAVFQRYKADIDYTQSVSIQRTTL